MGIHEAPTASRHIRVALPAARTTACGLTTPTYSPAPLELERRQQPTHGLCHSVELAIETGSQDQAIRTGGDINFRSHPKPDQPDNDIGPHRQSTFDFAVTATPRVRDTCRTLTAGTGIID